MDGAGECSYSDSGIRSSCEEQDKVDVRSEEEKNKHSVSTTSISSLRDTIPRDLMIEILARLPAKSLKRFQCVSKEWLSIIQNQVFIDLFNSVSRTRSRFLVAVRIADNHVSLLSSSHGEIERSLTSLITELEMKKPPAIMGFLASASQLTNLDITMSRVVTDCARSASLHTSLDMTMSGVVVDLVHCSSVNGIFGTAHPVCPGRFTICNPTTRQVISLPDIDPSTLRRVTTFKDFRRSTSTGYLKGISLFLGYDPVNNEYKALCSMNLCHTRYQVYKVLTLGGGGRNLSWRDVNKDTRVLNHQVITNGICINGVVYYGGWTSVEKRISNVYCFDVRSERMGLAASDLMLHARKSLINYNGKLGVVYPVAHAHSPHYYLDVLDEFEQEFTVCRWSWSHHRIDLHPLLTGMAGSVPLRILGTNDASELIVGPVKLPPKGEPLNIFYCKTVGDFAVTRRVELEGFEQFGCNHPSGDKNCVCQIFISPEHFENLVSL